MREQFGAWCGAKGQGEAQEGVEGVRVTEPLVSQRRLALWLALPVDSYPIHARVAGTLKYRDRSLLSATTRRWCAVRPAAPRAAPLRLMEHTRVKE